MTLTEEVSTLRRPAVNHARDIIEEVWVHSLTGEVSLHIFIQIRSGHRRGLAIVYLIISPATVDDLSRELRVRGRCPL